jgi:hypothetical protein
MLSSASMHLAVAGRASPSVNRTTVPPCMTTVGFPRSLGHPGPLGLAGDLTAGELWPPASFSLSL